MAFFIGREREARRAYGFDEIALVPGPLTINPAEVDITTKIGNVELKIPFIASAMDGVVDVKFAGRFLAWMLENWDRVPTPLNLLEPVLHAAFVRCISAGQPHQESNAYPS